MKRIIKDPIYGYIELNTGNQIGILDCPYFQRLRNIVQTSYVAIYPTSLHNRFTHSLGVFYLGNLVANKLVEIVQKNEHDFYEKNKDVIINLIETFRIACLLHDVGHAPFSHTGEQFYFNESEDGVYKIWKDLKIAVNTTEFLNDAQKVKGAPHEIMSALLSIHQLSCYFDANFDKELFTRCIIGLKYTTISQINSFKNCLIELLNSQTIDVDRLDYLIRDSYMSGYNNTTLDFQRLLTSIYLIKNGEKYELGFTKAALSVLENAIIAHDSERKWLQTHPSVVYENFLINGMIKFAASKYKEKGLNLFSEAALTELGLGKSASANHIKLMSDNDILSFVKKYGYKEEYVNSYYNRALRRKALWKSESEYKVIFETRFSISDDGNLIRLERYFEKFNDLIKNDFVPVINQKSLDALNEEKNGLDETDISVERKKVLEQAIFFMEQLRALSKKHKCKFDFVILKVSQFSSGFNKDQFNDIKIYYPNLSKAYKLGKSINILKNSNSRENFFYIYTTEKLKNKNIINEIVEILHNFAERYLMVN